MFAMKLLLMPSPVRPVLPRGKPVAAADFGKAMAAVHAEDFAEAILGIHAGMAVFRQCARVLPDGSVAAHAWVWERLADPARELFRVVKLWLAIDRNSNPRWARTWRQHLVVTFALVYANACWKDRPVQQLDELLQSLARMVMRGERRGGHDSG